MRAVVAQDPDTDPISYFIRAPGSNQDAEVYKMVSYVRAHYQIYEYDRNFT